MKFINKRRAGMAAISTLALSAGMLVSAPAQATETNSSNDFHFTVIAKSFDYGAASVSLHNETRLSINGAEQVTWEQPNHHIKVSAASVKRAPKITTRCTSSNRFNQSKQISKMTHGASIVVLKPGSCAWNRGKQDKIRVGFKWSVKSYAVLKVDGSHRYRHVYNWKNGKLVKTCANYIGGTVDRTATKVVQVRYNADVQKSVTVEATSKVTANVEFGVTCPNGAFFKLAGSGSAYGHASATVSFTERTRVSAMSAKQIELVSTSHANGQSEAVSKAQLSLDVSGSCGSTPPPPPPPPPASPKYSCDLLTLTKGDGRTVQIGSLRYTAENGAEFQDAVIEWGDGSTLTSSQPVGKPHTYAADGSYTVKVIARFSVNGVLKTATSSNCQAAVSFNTPPPPPPPATPAPVLVEISTINDVLVNNTRTIDVSGSTAPGHPGTLVCSAKNGGSITVGKTQSVSGGSFAKQITYKAPSEVPGANGNIAAGHDVVSCTLTQDDGQKDSISTNQFEIRPAPVDPL